MATRLTNKTVAQDESPTVSRVWPHPEEARKAVSKGGPRGTAFFSSLPGYSTIRARSR